jgi:hypothetical protein
MVSLVFFRSAAHKTLKRCLSRISIGKHSIPFCSQTYKYDIMWQETLLNNISSGLLQGWSPLNALAAETFKTGFPSNAMV